ncbi:putative protease [Dendrosporobacter quercicolus]|uniref:Putative protease n=1 Tax=Dendrosporobacter quercicolus TaxID=146817 RepID=A0A1G9KL71_9FIRM|nr:putative protease [Dendrosporobacter quercicolus]
MKQLVELLAPVGSKEALCAAVESGADAVYLAGKLFGARAYAPNFDHEQLAEAIRFAHLRGVAVYVAVNTIVDNNEMAELAAYLQFLYQAGADAIIVQDLGVAYIARQVTPGLPLHASTQMTVHNLAGVTFLSETGFRRVVLARELALADIKYICQHSKAEIETFIHGALCICYSGQCLMSGMIGGRSGNRGRCAQPCRLPYTLVDEQGQDVLQQADTGEYLLSPKDLNTLELIPDFITAGVKSFKIEGRMKRPEYVAIVVDTYRRAIDAALNDKAAAIGEQEQKDLAQIFNRDFTTAYLSGRPGRNMMSDRRPNNRGVRIGRVTNYQAAGKLVTIKLDEPLNVSDIVEFWVKVGGRVSANVTAMTVNGQSVMTAPAGAAVTITVQSPVRINDRVFKVYDARLMERAQSFFAGPSAVRRIGIAVKVSVAEGRPLTVEILDSEGFTGTAQTNFIAERALKRPLNRETIAKQIERLGTTVFELRELECSVDGEVMVPISEINDARRRAVAELEKARLERFKRPALEKIQSVQQAELSVHDPVRRRKALTNARKPELSVHVDQLDKVEAALAGGADVIVFGGENFSHQPIGLTEYREAVKLVRRYGRKITLSTPRLVKEWQRKVLAEEFRLFGELKPDAVSVGNVGTLQLARTLLELPLHGDYPLNIYNNAAIAFLAGQGLSSVTLSPELNFSQVEDIAGKSPIPVECIVQGHLTLMVSEHCSMGSYLGGLHAGSCSKVCRQGYFWLKDRKNERFPVITDQFCRMHVLNAKELNMLPHVLKFGNIGVDRIRIEGKYSQAGALGKITRLYREILDQGEKHPRLAEPSIPANENQALTRGHYFRGVL